MHMRMVDSMVTPPGVQRAEEPQTVGANKPRTRCQFANRVAAGVEDRLVADPRVGADDLPQPVGHGKTHQIIGHGQQLRHALGQPDLRFVRLAVGTMPIPATSAHLMRASAGVTFVVQVSQLTRTTTRDDSEHSFVLGRHPVGVLAQVAIGMLPQRFGDGRHVSYFGLRLPRFRLPESRLAAGLPRLAFLRDRCFRENGSKRSRDWASSSSLARASCSPVSVKCR